MRAIVNDMHLPHTIKAQFVKIEDQRKLENQERTIVYLTSA